MKIQYVNDKSKNTYVIIQNKSIITNTNRVFEATYKGSEIYITRDHGHGKSKDKDLKRFDIVVTDLKSGMYDVNTWEDLVDMTSAIKYALIGATLIKTNS